MMDGRVRAFQTSAKPHSQPASTPALSLVSPAPVPKAAVQRRRVAGARTAAVERSDPGWKEF
jgi:hypothetical protein